jgi:two-component system, NarL family, response regulator LiaR
MSIRIVIVDDHPVLRQGLRWILEAQPDLAVVGEAASGHEAVQVVKQFTPDLVIMDVHMPDLNGLEVSRLILTEHPELKIIIFSAEADQATIEQALQLGVCGYLLKFGGSEEVIRAIHQVKVGRLYLCPELASEVFSDYKRRLTCDPAVRKLTVSDRERQFLRLLAEGLQNKEIAVRLNVSAKSVEKTRYRLMNKLGYHSVAELTRYAVREGIAPS